MAPVPRWVPRRQLLGRWQRSRGGSCAWRWQRRQQARRRCAAAETSESRRARGIKYECRMNLQYGLLFPAHHETTKSSSTPPAAVPATLPPPHLVVAAIVARAVAEEECSGRRRRSPNRGVGNQVSTGVAIFNDLLLPAHHETATPSSTPTPQPPKKLKAKKSRRRSPRLHHRRSSIRCAGAQRPRQPRHRRNSRRRTKRSTRPTAGGQSPLSRSTRSCRAACVRRRSLAPSSASFVRPASASVELVVRGPRPAPRRPTCRAPRDDPKGSSAAGSARFSIYLSFYLSPQVS
jgi:hypothetical protein